MDPGVADRSTQLTFDHDGKTKCISKPDLWLFAAQIILIFIVVCTSLINLTLQIGNQQLFTVVLTGTLGYLLPNPKLKVFTPKNKDVPSAEVATF